MRERSDRPPAPRIARRRLVQVRTQR